MEQSIGRLLWSLQTTGKTGEPKKGQERFGLDDRRATSQDGKEQNLTIQFRKSVKMWQRAAVEALF